ncbi:DUF1317 family protein [Mixta mediterraneensis]|uniref:DUF1317 family protein n=1 Tax=Mixta mediterraneensis TaxID=2758443 RepID=UPI0018735147|nr:DUF1317 family protein [Mixta mediterraneensis]MBE5254563.1 DUF1317 family protein [Mixta mediterraneensis]
MRQPYSPIRVGSVTLPFLWAKKAWLLPDNTLTSNPLKAQRLAEERNEQLKLLAAALNLSAA